MGLKIGKLGRLTSCNELIEWFSGSPKYPLIALNFVFWLSLFYNFWSESLAHRVHSAIHRKIP